MSEREVDRDGGWGGVTFDNLGESGLVKKSKKWRNVLCT